MFLYVCIFFIISKSDKFNYFCQVNALIGPILSKLSNIFKGEHKNFRIFVAFSTAVFVFIWIVGPGNTWIHWAKAGLEIKRQERQIKEYQLEIEKMDKTVNMLKTDRDTLEKFAREHFQFAAPGDDVYVIE